MSNELQILNQNSIVTAFATKGGINEIFERVAAEVRKEVPDVTTKKGRDAIGSLAMKVSKSKKIVEDAGKNLVAEQKAKAKIEKAEREKQEAIEREAKLKHEAEQAIIREQQAKEAAEKAAKQAEIDKQNAIEAERLRIKQQQEAEAAHAAKLEEQRKTNIEHMRQINNDILSSIIKTGITEDQAKEIIKLIAKNEVPHVSIKY